MVFVMGKFFQITCFQGVFQFGCFMLYALVKEDRLPKVHVQVACGSLPERSQVQVSKTCELCMSEPARENLCFLSFSGGKMDIVFDVRSLKVTRRP